MNSAEAFVRQAIKLGIKRIYGNPGTTEMPLLSAVKENGMDYILLLNDGLAVASAEGESLFTSKPSLVSLHTINGLGNAIAYIYTALKNRSPVIVTAGQQDERFIFEEPILYADLKKVASTVVKASFEPNTPEDVPKYLIRAWKTALTPPYGPVFLSLPLNLMESEIEYEVKDANIFYTYGVNEELLTKVAEIINQSQNPAIVAGYEVDVYNLHETLREFVEYSKIPVYAEPVPIRAPFNSDHPLFNRELPPFAPLINYILKDHDLILLIGSTILLYIYAPEELLKGKKVIQLTYDPEEASKRIWDTIVCDLDIFLKNLKKLVKPKNLSINKKEEIKVEQSRQQDLILYSLKKFVKDRSIFFEAVSSEQAIHKFLGYKPKGYFFTKTSHLGWALPASIGFALAGGKPLVLIGDGSLNYAPQTLWTISKLNLNVKVLVVDNQGYGILRDGAYMKYRNIIDEYWMNPVTDTVSISKAYKVDARECESIEKIEECLSWLMNDNSPKLLSVKVERSINPLI